MKAHQEAATAEQAAGTAKPAAVAAEATREERLEDAEASDSRGASSSAACHFARSPRALQQPKPAVEKNLPPSPILVAALLPPSLPFSLLLTSLLLSSLPPQSFIRSRLGSRSVRQLGGRFVAGFGADAS